MITIDLRPIKQIDHLDNILYTYTGSRYFAQLDLSSAYFQLRLTERSSPYPVFRFGKPSMPV